MCSYKQTHPKLNLDQFMHKQLLLITAPTAVAICLTGGIGRNEYQTRPHNTHAWHRMAKRQEISNKIKSLSFGGTAERRSPSLIRTHLALLLIVSFFHLQLVLCAAQISNVLYVFSYRKIAKNAAAITWKDFAIIISLSQIYFALAIPIFSAAPYIRSHPPTGSSYKRFFLQFDICDEKWVFT